MRKFLILTAVVLVNGVCALGDTSFAGSFEVQALFGSTNQTFVTSAFSSFDPSLGLLTGFEVSLSGTLGMHNADVEELTISMPDTNLKENFVNTTPGDWSLRVNIDATDMSPADVAFFGGISGPIETEVKLADTNSTTTIDSGSLSGDWTWIYTPVPEPSSLGLCLGGVAVAAGWRKRFFRG